MNDKSEQIDSRLNIVIDTDQPLSSCELGGKVIDALQRSNIGSAYISTAQFKDKARHFIAYSTQSGEKHAFLTAAITFLGGCGNHPIFKKRIQLKDWFKPMCTTLIEHGFIPHFLGVYHYEGNVVFADFATETYLQRKMHNSSAFVYVNDLFRAMKDGIATRIDLHGNKITTIRYDKIVAWLNPSLEDNNISNLLTVFKGFNQIMSFNNWIKASSSIVEMHDCGWSKWRETEWAGWFLEFKFATYLQDEGITSVFYQGNASKTKDALDFDLIFPIQKFYGDLKASDIAEKMSPGNDKANLIEAINRCDRFWYVIYEHETVKDKTCDNEMTKFRYEYMVSLNDPKAKGPLSYANRMKNSVKFKRMMILELNRANCGEILSEFNQGHQPNGEKRAVKFLINKRNVENYQVFHYETLT